MLGWALTFLVIALIAAVLGFGGIAGAAAGIAKVIFFIFIIRVYIPIDVCTVAIFGLIKMTSFPSSFKALIAWEPL